MIALRQVPGNIVAALVFFVLGETGFVRKESSFAVAWIVGVLVVGAVILGTPDQAEATCNPDDYEIENCTQAQCDMYCRVYRDCWNNYCVMDLCLCRAL